MTFHKLQPEEMEVMWRKFITRDKKQICANTERKTSPVLQICKRKNFSVKPTQTKPS